MYLILMYFSLCLFTYVCNYVLQYCFTLYILNVGMSKGTCGVACCVLVNSLPNFLSL